ncbi:MAG: archaellin/type IV pilin N-terminal domain-containing protein [Dehalococcoidia bacterium]
MLRFHEINKKQKGITGLETAIILIAFVVVAAVFAYTVLSAGLFSSQESSEAVYAGLEEAQSSLEIKGSVHSDGVSMVENCEDAWVTAGAVATLEAGAANVVEGSGSALLTAIGSDDAAIEAFEVVPSTGEWDISGSAYAYFWVKSSVDLSGTAGDDDIQLVFSQAADLSTQDATVNIPASAMDTTWHQVSAAITGTRNSINSVGIYCVDGTNISGNLYVDCIEVNAFQDIDVQPNSYATQIVFTVTNVLKGAPIDFTTTTDTYGSIAGTEGDGYLGDETTQSHGVIVTYSDKYQFTQNLAWTKTPVGYDDGDNLLEDNEQYLITVDLSYVNNSTATTTEKIQGGNEFNIELKPPSGAVLVIQKTMPTIVHPVDALR